MSIPWTKIILAGAVWGVLSVIALFVGYLCDLAGVGVYPASFLSGSIIALVILSLAWGIEQQYRSPMDEEG